MNLTCVCLVRRAERYKKVAMLYEIIEKKNLLSFFALCTFAQNN